MQKVGIRTFTIAVLMALPVYAASPESAKPGTPPDNRPARKERNPAQQVRSAPVPLPSGGTVDRDVVYGKGGDIDLKMDIYRPAAKESSGAAPCAVYIHGGGWEKGDKTSGGWFANIAGELLARGYVVAAVDYRLGPQYKWPAYINDCKCAVRFLRANATKYNIDPARIGTWGSSAGGHLVALLGTADASAKLEGDGGYPDQSSRVQAVVDFFGPADMTRLTGNEKIRNLFGDQANLKQASPVTYISKDDPPFLIIQGDKDPLVNPEQSKLLEKQLKAAGVSATLVMVKNGVHGTMGRDIQPTHEEIVKKVIEFFDEHLRSGASAGK